MRKLFKGYYPGEKANLDSLISNSKIVFDSDALLSFFRLREENAIRILDYFIQTSAVKSRLWLPFDIALRYHVNMNEIILNEIQHINSTLSSIRNLSKAINDNLHYPYVKQETSQSLYQVLETAKADMTENQTNLQNAIRKSSIKDKINTLYLDKVGPEYDEGELNTIYDEGENRSNKDCPLQANIHCKDLREKYHDLIVWKQIINYASTNSTDVMFVLGTLRHEWFYIVNDMAISPRQELVNEFTSASKI